MDRQIDKQIDGQTHRNKRKLYRKIIDRKQLKREIEYSLCIDKVHKNLSGISIRIKKRQKRDRQIDRYGSIDEDGQKEQG